jgi:HAD superfamily hydrolase (TIGR01509 family)
MSKRIEAIIFDMGGTLRVSLRRSPAKRLAGVGKIAALIDTGLSTSELAQQLSDRYRAYRRWSIRTNIELNEQEQWTQWLLPDLPAELVSSKAQELNQLWRDATGKRVVFPETQETVLTLFRRGYRLGMVSNTTSSVEVPRTLDECGISGCFETVVLSCVEGIRKPDPRILLEATRRMGVQPDQCAYIGDRPDRDVAAARAAGFGRAVLLRDPRNYSNPALKNELVADDTIHNLKELLEIFPARARNRNPRPDGPLYDVTLSTMWAKNKFGELNDFFLAAGRLGYPKLELNHQVSSEMLRGINLGKYQISSIHEPCPAEISAETLKQRDWLISSPNEEYRQIGLAAVKRSIDLAAELSVRTVVVHAGQVSTDMTLENELRKLYNDSQTKSVKFQEIKQRMQRKRQELAGSCMQAAGKSLKELVDYSGRLGVRLGLENRYHYYDIPTLNEMSALLALAEPDRIGFIYDVGHAMAMDRLGFFPHELWLKRFGKRIFGSHLHDIIGLSDHRAPGLGEVDFRMVAGYLPKDSFRTVEVLGFNSPEQLKTGLKKLVETGCVNLIQ